MLVCEAHNSSNDFVPSWQLTARVVIQGTPLKFLTRAVVTIAVSRAVKTFLSTSENSSPKGKIKKISSKRLNGRNPAQ